MSFIVALAFLASVVDMSVTENPNEPLQYLNILDDATKSHRNNVMFLQKLVEEDYFWWPILNEPVKVKVPKALYFNQYVKPEDKETQKYKEQIVWPFISIADLIISNTFTGSDVKFTMDVLKSAMTCSVLKRISMQALMYVALITKFDETEVSDDEQVQLLQWLLGMIKLALNKLIALNHSHDQSQPITQAYTLLDKMRRALVDKTNSHSTTETLSKISSDMYKLIEQTCAVPTGEHGHYSALVTDFDKNNIDEDLKKHHTKLTDHMRNVEDLGGIYLMRINDDVINIEKDITVEGVAKLSEEKLKKATVANLKQMNFWFYNLPLQTMDESQLQNVFEVRESEIPSLNVMEGQ